jgi:hypothetical protein
MYAAEQAALKISGSSRTGLFMGKWLIKHVPGMYEKMMAGQIKITPTYRRLKDEYDRALFVAIGAAIKSGRDPHDLTERYEGGRFIIE